MITHAEAQALISERLDTPLDPYVEAVLEAHLATCAECRAFATSSDYLASSLQAMPTLPASYAVNQRVWAAIEQQERSWWRRFLAAMTGQTAAVVSTAAVALIVIAIASITIMQLVDTNDGDNEPEARLAAGTQENIALSSGTSEPTATADDVQQEPTVTATAGETATSNQTLPEMDTTLVPDSTSTHVSTSVPEPTNPPTETPEATNETVRASDNPTVPPENADTGSTSATDEGPTDLTGESSTTTTTEGSSAVENLQVFDPSDLLATAEATLKASRSSATEPTATATHVHETETPAPTATSEPPTETPVPTSTPEPPTETPVPTATPEPPTETPVPTSTPEPPTETPVPTSTPEPPTETPTATPQPPTETPEDTSPIIEPVDGATVVDAPETSSAGENNDSEQVDDGDHENQDEDTPLIGPPGSRDESASSNDTTEDDDTSEDDETTSGSGSDNQLIEPADGSPDDDASTDIAIDDVQATESDGTSGGIDIANGSGSYSLDDAEYYSDGELWGSPNDRLGYHDGLDFSSNPDGRNLQRGDLEIQENAGDDGNSIAVCGNGDCMDATSDSAEGAHSDTAIGWVGDRLIYQRVSNEDGGNVELRAVSWNGGPTSDERLGTLDAPISPIGTSYRVANGTLIPTTSSWLLIGDNDARVVDDNPYGDVALVRTNFNEDLITYVAGGNVIVANITSPGSAQYAIPFNGVDYDLSTSVGAVAISTGHGIEIYDLSGTRIGSSDSSIATGSLIWLREGIVFIDQTNNKIRLVDPSFLADQ